MCSVHQDHSGRAPGEFCYILIVSTVEASSEGIWAAVLILDLLQAGLALRFIHHDIHPPEAHFQCFPILPIFVLFQLHKLITELFFDPYRHLFASVAVKDPEARDPIWQVGTGDVGIFLRLTPSLHARGSPLDGITLAVLRLFVSVWCSEVWSHCVYFCSVSE